MQNFTFHKNKSGLHANFGDESIAEVVAIYSYNGDCSESSIAMEAGEEFIVTDGDNKHWFEVLLVKLVKWKSFEAEWKKK